MVPPDFELLSDPTLLDAFFSIPGTASAAAPISTWNRTLLQLTGRVQGTRQASWLGVLTFLRRCLEGTADLCAWIDPDVAVWRSGDLGLLDVAPQAFEAHPQYFMLSAPWACSDLPLGHRPGECCHSVASHHYFSQRMMVFSRSRLAAALPLQLPASWQAPAPSSTSKPLPEQAKKLFFDLGGGRVVEDAIFLRGGGGFEDFVPRLWKGTARHLQAPPRGFLSCGRHKSSRIRPATGASRRSLARPQ